MDLFGFNFVLQIVTQVIDYLHCSKISYHISTRKAHIGMVGDVIADGALVVQQSDWSVKLLPGIRSDLIIFGVFVNVDTKIAVGHATKDIW